MDYETLFTAAKWDVLRALAKSKKSPIELAEHANTSVSNISQSLRFLELAGIVKSERISNRDKGQPRVVYSLAAESAYIILTAKNLVNKKTVKLDDHKKMLLNVWFYDEDILHPFLESAVLDLEEYLGDIDAIFLDKTSSQDLVIAVVMKDKSAKKELKDSSLKKNGLTKKIKYLLVSKEFVVKSASKYYPIYDPHNFIFGEDISCL
ncbi:MAG: ArsR family transcriptional regulator [Candidatus Woesearchaeota archaeon]|jgi:DNA-binding MarR family transcriptional regulator